MFAHETNYNQNYNKTFMLTLFLIVFSHYLDRFLSYIFIVCFYEFEIWYFSVRKIVHFIHYSLRIDAKAYIKFYTLNLQRMVLFDVI